MNERIQRLQDIFASLDAEATFTERQQAARGDVLDDTTVDARLAEVVEALQADSGFRTALDTGALVEVVRGYYDEATDAEIAARLDASTEQVARARVNLHLFRPADTAAPFDVGDLRERLDEGADTEAIAAELGVSEAMVRRYAHVLRVQRAARRSGYRYPEEYEELLGLADDSRLADTHLTDRRTMDEVVD